MDYVEHLIEEKNQQIRDNNNVFSTGRVVRVNDYVVEVRGLEDVGFFEKVNIANKAIGYVNEIREKSVIVAVLKEMKQIKIGDIVYSTREEFTAYFSKQSVSRIIDMFGEDKLSHQKFTDLSKISIESPNTPIMDRTQVNRPLLTGISGIDLIYPIGKGQRQLIIGDKKTGKTQICLDTIVNQKGKNVLCIYVAIGKNKKEIKEIYSELAIKGALSHTIIITAFNDEKPPVLVLTPYFALSVADHIMKQIKLDILVVIDDLKRQADAYREMSLLSGKSPGRDAYPSDIFYLHSRLLEKGCQYKNGGSITILPIVETKNDDITDYISTNVISITDGQIVLSSKKFQKGEKPAINYGLSVSRLGGAVQEEKIKVLGAKVRRQLLNYMEAGAMYELANIDEMSEELRAKIIGGKKIISCLNQYKFCLVSNEENIQKFSFLNGEDNEN